MFTNKHTKCKSTTEWVVTDIIKTDGDVKIESCHMLEVKKIPLWAANQELFEKEPPKPPRSVAEFYVLSEYDLHQLIPPEVFSALWEQLPPNKKEMYRKAHRREFVNYEKNLEKFSKTLDNDEYYILIEKYSKYLMSSLQDGCDKRQENQKFNASTFA